MADAVVVVVVAVAVTGLTARQYGSTLSTLSLVSGRSHSLREPGESVSGADEKSISQCYDVDLRTCLFVFVFAFRLALPLLLLIYFVALELLTRLELR